MAVIRCDNQNQNYRVAYSADGITWDAAKQVDYITNGSNSKPTLHRFGNHYYLGWQEKPERSRFNLLVSKDARKWDKAVSFVCPGGSFQYPEFIEYEGEVYFVGSIGNKQALAFGHLGSVDLLHTHRNVEIPLMSYISLS